jgi:hypothetical protein
LVVAGSVIIAGGMSAVKMSSNEVQWAEQHTGTRAGNPSEEQFEAAMSDRGIVGQEPTDQEPAVPAAHRVGSLPRAGAAASIW